MPIKLLKKTSRLFLISIFLLLVISYGTCVNAATTDSKYESYSNPNALISVLELKKKIDNKENFVLIDIRRSIEYMVGHIQGAVNLWRPDYEAAKERFDFGGMAASKIEMETLLSEIGATQNSEIIVYSSRGQSDANRMYWQLKLIGHEKRRMVDGGIDTWSAAGYKKTIRQPVIKKTKYVAKQKTDPQLVASLSEVKAALKNNSAIVIDTRSLSEAAGEKKKKGAFRKGRIPGCIWLEYTIHLNEDGTFKTKEELIKIYKKIGVTKDKSVIAYCQSGVRSAQTIFVLRELIGYKNVKNYDGSWIEWSYYNDLPIEKGSL